MTEGRKRLRERNKKGVAARRRRIRRDSLPSGAKSENSGVGVDASLSFEGRSRGVKQSSEPQVEV